MRFPLNIPNLRREWRMSKALKDADLNKDVPGETAADNRERWNAIQSSHDERTKATFEAIIEAENKSLTIRDVWAILNLALCVQRMMKTQASLPLLRKAERD